MNFLILSCGTRNKIVQYFKKVFKNGVVVFGVLFLLQVFGNVISYETIFKLWPVILIGLGIEILLSNLISKKFVYDKGAVVLLILMVFLSVGMACSFSRKE